jgi:hypothetical protein
MRAVLLVSALLLASLGAACGDEDKPDATPSPSGPPDLSPRGGGLAAMRSYLQTEGVGGRKGAITDPVDCKEVPEGGADEEFCIIDDASTYAPGLVIVYVARVDSRDGDEPETFEDVWEVHLEPGEQAWQVTDVEEVPSS